VPLVESATEVLFVLVTPLAPGGRLVGVISGVLRQLELTTPASFAARHELETGSSL
jgi:hypothetical protein